MVLYYLCAIGSEFICCFRSLPFCVDDFVDVDQATFDNVTFETMFQCKSQICVHG